MHEMIKILDTVRLNDSYEDRQLFTVAEEVDTNGDIRMFPINGGMLCVANENNLEIVK